MQSMPKHYSLTEAQFLKLSRRGNVIPVYKEINADLDTPVSAYLKLSKDGYSFLLESVEGQEKIARYSFLGTRPALVLSAQGREVVVAEGPDRRTRRFRTDADALAEIKKLMSGFIPVPVPGLPRFWGGLVGYLGYDMVRFFERLPEKNGDVLKVPDAYFMLADALLVFDHVSHTIRIVANCILPVGSGSLSRARKLSFYRGALRRIDEMHRQLQRPLQAAPASRQPRAQLTVRSNCTAAQFCAMVRSAKRHIRNGDIIQTVLSQRLSARIGRRDPFDVYRALRRLNPSPYMFFLRMGEVTLVGSSPEVHLRCEDGLARIRPIAGTRPRSHDEARDALLERQLLKDGKERAEHIMLVDLARNDLGRVSRPGSVRVDELMSVERYSHVMHLVSEVSGRIDPRYDIYDCLRASFPAGTVSGSPKIRAMEIIEELEGSRRGPYAGCVGYIGFTHNLDTCITIRTILVKNGYAHVQAGAGIVADSVPSREYAESLNKAQALLEALVCSTR